MWYGTCGDASPDDEREKYPLPADDAGDKGVMGVLGDESRDDDADDVCVLIVVVCACESIFRFFLSRVWYVDRIVLLVVVVAGTVRCGRAESLRIDSSSSSVPTLC